MNKPLSQFVRDAGVVGAGGGGFPSHIKLEAKADTVIANGAECEPLLHKDAAVIEQAAAEIVRGLSLSMEAVGASEGIVGIKQKNQHAIEAMERACKGTRIHVHKLGDYYPAGDEYDLVYSTTGRLIPPGGLPINVGAVVNNVETLANIAAAADGRPVTHKYITIAGAVAKPVSLLVPIGSSYREIIASQGGFACETPMLVLGGLMMGAVTDNLDTPVTKTSTGVVVLPREHSFIARKLRTPEAKAAIGKSACDQCRYCTEFCPRYLLGYDVQPHAVMRSLAFTATGAEYWNQLAALCCSCGLCTLYACPEQLYPKEACDDSKAAMRKANQKWSGPTQVSVHPMRDGRRVPVKSLVKKLAVGPYDVPAPFVSKPFEPKRLVLPLKQNAGSPCLPLVKAGDSVRTGQAVGAVPEKALGAALHAPVAGKIEEVTAQSIVLVR